MLASTSSIAIAPYLQHLSKTFLPTCFVQLLQNIIKSTELHFPPESKDLSSDCKDLCQKLLRRNPGTWEHVANLYG